VSLVTGGGHGPASVAAEAGGSAPECTGESLAAVEAAGRSGAAHEMANPNCAVPEQGLKCVVPEQGTSDRPMKKPGCAPRCKSPTSSLRSCVSSDLFVDVVFCLCRRRADTGVLSLAP
jgi:hypothetical protein